MVVELFNDHEEFVIVLAPEGSRSLQKEWRTGFYRIAIAANVPILMVGFNFKRKVVEVNQLFWPTGDMEKDIEKMKAYYRTVSGKNPELGVQ
jgi:1-acyl-sn-glycerol-3-phosphate acyltransferase